VRRFNWFQYEWPELLDWQANPDVTKRTVGVMEKCTFCVQRIAEARDIAKDLGRLVEDGDVTPACVQTCPTQALTFGNLKDPNSRVSKVAKSERAYKVLDHHLNTQPSVSYLNDIRYKA
jgi:molybdopterin-containing oxidoreductase family iron-sulfur binding subunit